MKIRIKSSCSRNYQTAFQFDYERAKGTENAKWLQLTGKQSMEKFIPLTRKTLLKTILEDKEMISLDQLDGFQKLATGIDSLLYMNYKKKLDAIKVYICCFLQGIFVSSTGKNWRTHKPGTAWHNILCVPWLTPAPFWL